MLHPTISKKCRRFVLSHWGRDGLEHVKERPVSWVLYEANPHIKALRRRQKSLPLISLKGEPNVIYLSLSTERRRYGAHHRG
jgi:hypothetical protein